MGRSKPAFMPLLYGFFRNARRCAVGGDYNIGVLRHILLAAGFVCSYCLILALEPQVHLLQLRRVDIQGVDYPPALSEAAGSRPRLFLKLGLFRRHYHRLHHLPHGAVG